MAVASEYASQRRPPKKTNPAERDEEAAAPLPLPLLVWAWSTSFARHCVCWQRKEGGRKTGRESAMGGRLLADDDRDRTPNSALLDSNASCSALADIRRSAPQEERQNVGRRDCMHKEACARLCSAAGHLTGGEQPAKKLPTDGRARKLIAMGRGELRPPAACSSAHRESVYMCSVAGRNALSSTDLWDPSTESCG